MLHCNQILIAKRSTYMLLLLIACIASTSLESLCVHPDDISTRAASMMHKHGSDFKKYVKKLKFEFNTLTNATSIPGIQWIANSVAAKIARQRGCGEKELEQAKILGRFFTAGKLKKQAIAGIVYGEGATVLERVFSQLKKQVGTIRQTVEIRTALIDLLHQEMMRSLGLNGSKDWFCTEIERKNKKKKYVIHGDAFNIYLHQTALALFAMYWFETYVPH